MFDEHSYLYVEDDPDSRQVVEVLLTQVMGAHRLQIFEDSEGFISRLTNLVDQPDIILLDIHIKPLNGFEMLKLLRSMPAYQNTHIIALTASVMSEEIDRLKESGFNGAIAKPLKMKTFPALMRRVIEGESVWHIS